MSPAKQQLALDYIEVAERISTFREKHPEGSLQQVSLDFREVNGEWWVIYTAAAYRTPDDQRPGIGTAWEHIPGRTNFTKDSEVQNAETSAWGRAIVAALAGDTKRSIASAEEVRNRQADRAAPPAEHVAPPQTPANQARAKLAAYATEQGMDLAIVAQEFYEEAGNPIREASAEQVDLYLSGLKARMPA